MNKFTNFLLWLAGVSRKIITTCDEKEIHKHSLVGFQILLTTVLAMFTGGYAISKVFDSKSPDPSIIIGAILWGLTIMSLDKWAVSTIDKSKNWLHQFFTAVPRLIIAGFLSIAISKPIELRIFQNRITHQLLLNREKNKNESLSNSQQRYGLEEKSNGLSSLQEQKAEAKQKAASDPDTPEFIQRKQSCEVCFREKNELDSRLSPQLEALKAEKKTLLSARSNFDGGSSNQSSSRLNSIKGQINALNKTISNKRKDCNMMQDDLDKMRKAHLNFYNSRVQTLGANIDEAAVELDSINSSIASEFSESKSIVDVAFKENNLAAELEALGDLTSGSNELEKINLFFILLFLSIETAPVLFKLFSAKGEYEDKLEFEKKTKDLKMESDLLSQTLQHDVDARLSKETFDLKVEEQKVQETISITKRIIDSIVSLNNSINTATEKIGQKSQDAEAIANQLLELLKTTIGKVSNIFKQ